MAIADAVRAAKDAAQLLPPDWNQKCNAVDLANRTKKSRLANKKNQ
jgi:hypothetical protein